MEGLPPISSTLTLNGIKLTIYTDEEVRKLAVVQVSNPATYDRGLPKANGVNDPRMGVTDKALQCPTCGLTSTCNNHYGFIELEKPILRLGHVASTLFLLRSVCWACSQPKFYGGGEKLMEGLVDVRSIVARSIVGSKDRIRSISEVCKNKFKCPWTNCCAPQPVYGRVNKLFISRNFRAKEIPLFLCEDERAFASKRLMPDEIKSIIENIPLDALRVLGYKPEISHPQNYVYKAQLVPPPSIRPAMVASSTEARLRGENDLTVAFQDLVRANNELALCLENDKGKKNENKMSEKTFGAWDKVQIIAAAIINQNSKKLCTYDGSPVVHARAMGKRKAKVIKDRLTGKKGRLRGNLSGKRVDQAGRTVVGPDSSHDIFELGVPSTIMRTLTFPEHVNDLNLQELAEAVEKGANCKNGALTVIQGDESRVYHLSLMDDAGKRALAAGLKVGWTVERHLKDGDWVLFNRQPSLHKASIMAFQAYEVEGLQFKLPLPCTKPFNADFDGDEMNIHALQDYPAICEAQELMAVPHQMVTPQNNSVLIALVQDSIVGAFMMTRKDAFIEFDELLQLTMCIKYNAKDAASKSSTYWEMPARKSKEAFFDHLGFHLPIPAILKAGDGCKKPRWTGKQLLSLLLPKSLSLIKPINNADFSSVVDLWNDQVVTVFRGEILSGRLCKQTVGSTSSGIVHVLWKKSPWAAAKFVSDAQRLMMQWLRKDTVCISILDCLTPCEKIVDKITSDAMGRVDALATTDIPFAVKEVKQTQILQETLREVGAAVLDSMDTTSGIATVVASGSKGNLMNIAQIAGLVGQQTINGSRIGFRKGPSGPRTLANFSPGDNSPEARGFVASSYMMGLQPSEYFFHQQAGREGVVATAVSTADTGYNQRRMVKNQESLVVAYDGSVRVSSNLVVQQHYGGDDYEGSMVERIKVPGIALLFDQNELNGEALWKAVASLSCAQTPDDEKGILYAALEILGKTKYNFSHGGMEQSSEIAMPVNIIRIMKSLKIGSSIEAHNNFSPIKSLCSIASPSNILRRILINVLKSHHTENMLDEIEDWSLLELLTWPSRDWRATDDPSLSSRACLALQCTTKIFITESIFESIEDEIVDHFTKLYVRGIVNPGEGVGAVGSSSIGEPSTQMTLNIFHYSGIAEKNVTLTGLPRFKQIINAVDTYDTANMRIFLKSGILGENSSDHKFNARSISSKLAKTSLSQIVCNSKVINVSDDLDFENISNEEDLMFALEMLTMLSFGYKKQCSSPSPLTSFPETYWLNDSVKKLYEAKLLLSPEKEEEFPKKKTTKCDQKNLQRLCNFVSVFEISKAELLSRQLDLEDVGLSLSTLIGPDGIVTWSPKWCKNWIISVRPPTWGFETKSDRVVSEAILDSLHETAIINGIGKLKKAVPIYERGKWLVETEGSDLIQVSQISDVDALLTTTNNIQEVANSLGVEAAICLMQSELHRVLSFDGSYVDPRHTWLLSDTVARAGCINPLNRHKMEELGGSLLQCASFEQTLDVFEHGAAFGKSDNLGGATEKLIVGQPVHVGTGSFDILSSDHILQTSQNCATMEQDVKTRGNDFVAPLFKNSHYNSKKHKALNDDVDMEVNAKEVPSLHHILKDLKREKSVNNATDSQLISEVKEVAPLIYGVKIKTIANVLTRKENSVFKPCKNFSSLVALKNRIERWQDESILKLIKHVIPSITVMRLKAPQKIPVWIRLKLWPKERNISVEEFEKIENALETYKGWVSGPRGNHFLQTTHAIYESSGKRCTTRVEYNENAFLAKSACIETFCNSNFELLEPFSSWKAKIRAISFHFLGEKDLPASILPTSVKIRQEKIFEKESWIIRLYKEWEARDILSAETLQREGSKACSFNLQIELDKPWDLLEERGSSDEAISLGFIERIAACLECCL